MVTRRGIRRNTGIDRATSSATIARSLDLLGRIGEILQLPLARVLLHVVEQHAFFPADVLLEIAAESLYKVRIGIDGMALDTRLFCGGLDRGVLIEKSATIVFVRNQWRQQSLLVAEVRLDLGTRGFRKVGERFVPRDTVLQGRLHQPVGVDEADILIAAQWHQRLMSGDRWVLVTTHDVRSSPRGANVPGLMLTHQVWYE